MHKKVALFRDTLSSFYPKPILKTNYNQCTLKKIGKLVVCENVDLIISITIESASYSFRYKMRTYGSTGGIRNVANGAPG